MQGSEKVIAALNMTLQEEFTALCQYFIHAEMCPRPWLVVSAGCSPAAIWCNSPPAAGCESPVGAEPFFCLRFPDVLVVILLPLIDLLVVNVSLARSRLIIPSFCRVNQDFHFGFLATIDYTSESNRDRGVGPPPGTGTLRLCGSHVRSSANSPLPGSSRTAASAPSSPGGRPPFLVHPYVRRQVQFVGYLGDVARQM